MVIGYKYKNLYLINNKNQAYKLIKKYDNKLDDNNYKNFYLRLFDFIYYNEDVITEQNGIVHVKKAKLVNMTLNSWIKNK